MLLPSPDVTVALGLSTALLRQSRVDEARSVLDPVLALSGSAEAQLVLGQLLLQEGRSDEALRALAAARRLNPDLPQLRIALGSALWRRRKTDAAIREWREELAANRDSFEAAYMLGSALSLREDTRAEAETLLRKALAVRPRNAKANLQLAKLVWQKSKSAEVLPFLERAIQTDPELREAFFVHGTVLQSVPKGGGGEELRAREGTFGQRARAAAGFVLGITLTIAAFRGSGHGLSSLPSAASCQSGEERSRAGSPALEGRALRRANCGNAAAPRTSSPRRECGCHGATMLWKRRSVGLSGPECRL